MKPRFEIFPGKDGKWYFRLRAGNGKIVCQSQGYGTKRHCVDGCWAVIRATQDIEDEWHDTMQRRRQRIAVEVRE